LNVQALRGLVKIAELGTVTRAAEALPIAQPALSRQIRGLERELGQPLFVRQGRRLQLTPFGRRVVEKAREVLREMDGLEHLGEDFASLRAMAIGASLTTLSGFLPRAVARFRKALPETDLVVHTGLSQDIHDMVGAGRIEIGVVSAPRPRPFIVTQPLFEDPLWLICPARHPLAHGAEAHPEDLHRLPLVTMTGRTVLRQDLNAILATCGVEPRICMEIDDIGAIERMVEAGLGVTVLPRSAWVGGDRRRSLAAIPFVLPDARTEGTAVRRFSLIRLGSPLSPAAETWVRVCLEVAAEFAAA
jgi:LysR family nitrogen assimilation transcriptional regulator